MKLRSTTPASVTLATRVVLVLASLLIMVAIPMQITQKVFADQYDDKINALQQEINQYQAEGNRLNSQADTLQTALSQLTSQRSAIQTQIDLSQAKHDQLVKQIADTEKQIKDNQDALGVTIANMYVDDKISPIEMLASSKTISDYLDKQEYQSSIRDQLTSTINKIKDLKTRLNKQKEDVSKVLENQKSQRDQLVAKEGEQANLLKETQGQEAAYQQLIGKNQSAIAQVRATQAALNARVNNGGGGTLIDSGLLIDYPWNTSNCFVDVNALSWGGSRDGQDGHGYGCRQCTSFAAWKVAKETGVYYQGWGNGGSFASSAINAGYQNYNSRPSPNTGGYIAVMWGNPGNPGHVAWIDSVSADGSRVVVEQYNYNYGAGWGMYSVVNWPTSAFNQYVKIN